MLHVDVRVGVSEVRHHLELRLAVCSAVFNHLQHRSVAHQRLTFIGSLDDAELLISAVLAVHRLEVNDDRNFADFEVDTQLNHREHNEKLCVRVWLCGWKGGHQK